MNILLIGVGVAALVVVVLAALSVRVVRPTHRGIVERVGKYHHYCEPGFHGVIPFVDHLYRIDVREVLVEAQPQEIITNDNLNAKVDAQVYFKVKADEENIKASQYNVTNYQNQIVNLARTTLRNIIGTLTLKSANSERGKINDELRSTLKAETSSWGIEIVRTELKEIDPPRDVQETMNKVVKAENEKIAALDFATATETAGRRQAARRDQEGRGRSSRPRSWPRRARPKPSGWSTRRPRSTSSATPSCCASWKPWRSRSGRTPRSWCRPTATSST